MNKEDIKACIEAIQQNLDQLKKIVEEEEKKA